MSGYDPLCTGYDPLCTGYDPLCTGYDPLCTVHDPLCTGNVTNNGAVYCYSFIQNTYQVEGVIAGDLNQISQESVQKL